MKELLQAILADPAADGPRQVYADWLLEQGDPRGELIQLQLAKPAGWEDHVRTLVHKHWKEWVGPLAPHIMREGLRFDRGFLEACVYQGQSQRATRALTGDPIWATVREITFMKGAGGGDRDWRQNPATALVSHPVMGALRVVNGLGATVTAALARGEPLPLHELGTNWPPAWPLRDREALADAPGLPSLRRLAIATHPSSGRELTPPIELRWVYRGRLAERLPTLTLGMVGPLFALMEELAETPIPRVEADHRWEFWTVAQNWGWQHVLGRDGSGALSTLECTYIPWARQIEIRMMPALLDELSRLDRDRITSLVVKLPKAAAEQDLGPLHRALRRFRRAERAEVVVEGSA